jgi:hypothetical protein
MSSKLRLSASVDAELLSAAQAAVDAGRADNISAWVNQALHRQAEHDRRLHALDLFLAEYEGAHGVITDQEIAEATRNVRTRALVVRSPHRTVSRAKRKRSKKRGR